MLEPSKDGNGLIDAILRADGAGREFLHMKAGGSLKPASAETVAAREHFVFQDGRPVFKAAVTGMVNTTQELLDRNDMTIDDLKWLVPHQANLRIIKSVGEMLGLAEDRVMVNIHKYGNTTAATIPLCLTDYEAQIKKGDTLVLTAFGGGYTWGSILIKWAY